MDHGWQAGSLPPSLSFMHDYTESLLGDLAPGSPPGRAVLQASPSGEGARPYGSSPADKKRRREEELGLKQWMENLGKPDTAEDLLHDDSMLFTGADALDFPMSGTYSMAPDSGPHATYGGFTPGMPLILPIDQNGAHGHAAWEPPPQDAEHASNEQAVRSKGGIGSAISSGTKRGTGRGGRGRGAAAAQSIEDLSETEKAAVSKACRERARRERLNESFVELGELLDPGKPSRTDKVSIIADAVKAITQLRAEAHQLRQLNKFLEERVSHSEKEKSHLMMQQALITQFMQTGQPVVLGSAQPQVGMWGQQQAAGPAPQVPASGQSMGQAVADISAGLRLMQQSPGGSLPPWPLPPGAQSQGAGPSHTPPPAPPTASLLQVLDGQPGPQKEQRNDGGLQQSMSRLHSQQQQQTGGGMQRTQSPIQNGSASLRLAAPEHGGQQAECEMVKSEADRNLAALSAMNLEIGSSQAMPLQQQPGVSQASSVQQQQQQQQQHAGPRPDAQHSSSVPAPLQQGRQQQQQQQPYTHQNAMPFTAPPPNVAPPFEAPLSGHHPSQQPPQFMQPPYLQGIGAYPGAGAGKPVSAAMASPFWLGGLDTDTSNDHVRRPPAA